MLLSLFKNEIKSELDHILTWWTSHMTDWENGGFLGRIDGYGRVDKNADKGIILNTRILWTYSKVYKETGESIYCELADRAYEYIISHLWDPEHHGVFWSVDFRGKITSNQKQIYAQAFAIYALSAYFEIHDDPVIVDYIDKIFNRIEKHSRDQKKDGYLNVFNEDWTLSSDQKLSAKDADQVKIMNTHLHILEAYTALYKIQPNTHHQDALRYILQIYLDRFCTRDPCHLYLFFDEDWNPTSQEKSFGHDIESSWLITEAAELLADPLLTIRAREVSLRLAESTYQYGKDDQGGIFEKTDSTGNEIENEKHWWPQAEAVVGFLNAWQLLGEEKYLTQALQTWHFIQNHFIDHQNGEWHWLVDENGDANRREDKAGPWKAPYHNVRMCLEVLHRLENMS